MFRLLRFLHSPLRKPANLQQNRCCSGFVSRMRFLNWLKGDDAACLAALQDGGIFLFHNLAPLLQRTNDGSFRPVWLSCSDVELILLGLGSHPSLLKDSVLIGCTKEKQAQFCLDVGDLDRMLVEERSKGTFVDMRKAFFLLSDPEAPLVAKGQALLRWHQATGFCSATGQLTYRNQAGSQRVCGSTIYYPKMSPVVLVLVSDGKRCLLGRQKSFPPGLYSALAGFCDMGESLEDTLRREVAEEVGLEILSMSFSSSQHWPFPQSSFMLGCHAHVSPTHSQLNVDQSELEDARWFTLDEISSALKIRAPPTRGNTPKLWLPPRHALANHLINEWAELQKRNNKD
ncbi:NAD(P)H pyrophosphatase NUDT13, mitochondrial isoform 1-T2 [Pholidichthys leucotaenia]